MAFIGEWIRRLGYLLRRRAHEDELRREMEAHRAAMDDPRAFGNTLRLQEQARDAWGWRWLDDLVQDTRFALRTLRRSPGFTLTAVLTLSLGIGVNIAMFRVVNALLLRPLYPGAGDVVGVRNRSTLPSGEGRAFSYPNYLDLREGTSDIFTSLTAADTTFVGFDDGSGARRAMAAAVTTNYFQTFGVALALGRPFTADEERPGAGVRVVILGHRLWEQGGSDPNVIGRLVRVNAERFTVIGVTPEGFTGSSIPGPQLWLPLGAHDVVTGNGPSRDRLGARDAHELSVAGRLRPGVSKETAAPALAAAARRLALAFPAINGDYTFETSGEMRLLFMPGGGGVLFTAVLTGMLMIMPAIVLLVACLNLVDLLLARGQVRRQEIAIRSSLGGGRGRLGRQLLTEGLALAVAGGAIGLVLSTWAINALLVSVRSIIPFMVSLPEFELDWRVLVGTIGFSLVATIAFGAWPAWSLTRRVSGIDLKRHAGDEGSRPGGIRIGNALVIGQVALSILLLASGGLFLMSALSAATADPGFRLDGGLVVEVDPSLAGYDDVRGGQAHRALVDRLRSVPGVDIVTIGLGLPFYSGGDSRLVAPAGGDGRTTPVDSVFNVVGRDYIRSLGLAMLSGRDFIDAELVPGGSEPVAIVDDVLAQRLWPGEGALGQLVQFRDDEGAKPTRVMRVVGVVPALKHSLFNPRPFPHVYVPLGQHYESAMTLQLRTADPNAERAMVSTIARVIRDFDPRLPVLRIQTWRDHVDTNVDVWLHKAAAAAFSVFASIALLLAVVGVYGVKSYVLSRRTREFGIRIATGAHPRVLLWQVLREGGRITAIGIGLGVLLALGAGQLFQGLLYGVNAVEPVVLIAAPAILLAASLVASYVPARRATRVDPVVALRAE